MFSRTDGACNIDSIECLAGTFKMPGGAIEPEIELTMVYSNKESGLRFGSCPARYSLLSEETKEAFLKFLELSEQDFGKAVFESGGIDQRSPYLGSAETGDSLPIGLGRG